MRSSPDASVASFAALVVSSPAREDEPLPESDGRLDPARDAGRAAGLTESRIACTQVGVLSMRRCVRRDERDACTRVPAKLGAAKQARGERADALVRATASSLRGMAGSRTLLLRADGFVLVSGSVATDVSRALLPGLTCFLPLNLGLFCFGMTTCESQARFEQICEHSFSSVTACQVSYQAAPKGSNDGHRPSTQHRHHHTRSQGAQRACTLPSPEEHVSNVESADFLLSNRAPCTSRSWTNWHHCTTPG